MLKLKDWAIREGINPRTAYNWFHDGSLPVEASRVGSRLIIVNEQPIRKEIVGKVIIYARVSSTDQKSDLDGQVERVSAWLDSQNIIVSRTVTEIGSGMNGDRSKLRRILADNNVKTIVVEHRDRFGMVNVELVESALAASGRNILVMNSTELVDDFVRDVTEVLTSLCTRLYGKRGAANRARRAIEKIQSQ